MSNKKYIIGNWKNHPDSLAEAEGILDSISEYLDSRRNFIHSLVVCPPFVFLEEIDKIFQSSSLGKKAQLGAQDIALSDSGAWTGEVSGHMLKRLGVRYVIVGHSERRWKLGETDDVVNKKIKTALANEFAPIVCVGERERYESYKDFLKQQLADTFAGLSDNEKGKCLVAYEPVWAISSNPGAKADTPESALESIAIIKEALGNVPVLYGGSVNSSNVESFISQDQIAGVLVGGASVNKEEFVKILSLV
ncbi:triose-phosphate isomerase [Candidatus Parcubacteria bacterium]|nr:triose-phosphate isomerase [Candidatus Parcubacteria bacterium]